MASVAPPKSGTRGQSIANKFWDKRRGRQSFTREEELDARANLIHLGILPEDWGKSKS